MKGWPNSIRPGASYGLNPALNKTLKDYFNDNILVSNELKYNSYKIISEVI